MLGDYHGLQTSSSWLLPGLSTVMRRPSSGRERSCTQGLVDRQGEEAEDGGRVGGRSRGGE